MAFTVKQPDIFRELSAIRGGLATVSSVPILSHVLLAFDGSSLKMTACDLEISISSSCPAVGEAATFAIPARRLLDYLALLPAEADVSFKPQDKGWVAVTADKSRVRFPISQDAFQGFPEPPPAMIEFPAGFLATGLTETIYAVIRGTNTLTINGVLIEVHKGGNANFVGTDAKRMAIRQMSLPNAEPMRVLVPLKAAAELLRLVNAKPSDTATLSIGNNCLHFRIGGDRTLTARKLAGEYPPYEKVIPQSLDKQVAVDAVEFRQALARCAQFAEDRDGLREVKITISQGKIEISAGGEAGIEDAAARYDGEPCEVHLNAILVLSFLSVVPTGQITISVGDKSSAVGFSPNEDYHCFISQLYRP